MHLEEITINGRLSVHTLVVIYLSDLQIKELEKGVFLSMPLNNNLTTNSSKYGKDSSKNKWSVRIPLI
jgi:hypothetical protein